MSNSVRPTKKQKEILGFIENFIAGHGYSPSFREIKSGLGYNSVSTVSTHVNNLITRGHLQKRTYSARSLEVVKDNKVNPGGVDRPSESQEKWLVAKINKCFEETENGKPAQKDIDKLYVLVGALKVLELDGAYTAFASRLSALKQRFTQVKR